MPPTSASTDSDARVLLGCFRAAGATVAIEVAQLREIVRHAPPTPLPGAPAEIEGVIDLRGRLVPVVDLGRALGGEPVRSGPRARIAIAELDGLWLGLAVDAALEILAVPASALCDPPALAAQAGCETTRSVVRRPHAPPLPVLSLEHLLERLYRSALSEGAQEDA